MKPLLALSASAVLLLAPCAQAAIPRDTTSTVVRIDGRRARITLTARTENPVISAINGPGEPRTEIRGGRVEAFVTVDMLDDQAIPEGLEVDRIRLVRATPDAEGRRTWNPAPDQARIGASVADVVQYQALDGPAWETGARVDARVRLELDGQAIIVELGQMRLGGDFTL